MFSSIKLKNSERESNCEERVFMFYHCHADGCGSGFFAGLADVPAEPVPALLEKP